jgi:hypothetical protein
MSEGHGKSQWALGNFNMFNLGWKPNDISFKIELTNSTKFKDLVV